MTDENKFTLNNDTGKFLYKSFNNYIITNVIIVLVPFFITIIVYCKLHNINMDCSLFWDVFKSPSFLIPVLIALFVKDILIFIFYKMGNNKTTNNEENE